MANEALEVRNGYEEAQLLSSLAHLQELHIQVFPSYIFTSHWHLRVKLTMRKLRRLRDAVPSIIRPMHADHPSPETVYDELSKAATGAVDHIHRFSELLRDERSQDILYHARETWSRKGDGVMNWLVSHHADWLDKPATNPGPTTQDNEADKVRANISRKRPAEIVQAFKDAHPKAEVNLTGDAEIIKVREHNVRNVTSLTYKYYLPAPTKLTFSIETQVNPIEDREEYRINCDGSGRLQAGVLQALADRPEPYNLYLTLVMSSYSFIVRCLRG